MFPTITNCHKCGNDFIDKSLERRSRICELCRKPPNKTRSNKLLEDLLGQPLTFREIQVVKLISEGDLNKTIGGKLHLAEGTIKTYLNVIFNKTGFSNRTALAVWWVKNHADSNLDGSTNRPVETGRARANCSGG